MHANPLVSIITPAFNAEKYIAKTILSVQAQTYKNWEHIIVVDSKTTDRTLEVATRFSQDNPNIKVLVNSSSNHVAHNRNLAIEHSKGEFIAFLDADDIWYANKLETQITFMLENNLDFSSHDIDTINEADKPLGYWICEKSPSYNKLLVNNSTGGCLAVVLKKDLLSKNPFKPVAHEDFVLWLEIFKKNINAVGLNQPLAAYRIHNKSRNSSKIKAALSRLQIQWNETKPNFLKTLFVFFSYLYFSLKKRI